MKPRYFISLICLFFIFSANIHGQKDIAIPANWQRVELGIFSISLPPSWSSEASMGVNSYFGSFRGDNVILQFERGLDSVLNGGFASSRYTILYETVGGKSAQVVFPKASEGMTVIYFPNIYGAGPEESHYAFVMVTFQQLNRSQREVVLKIFRSIKINSREN